MGSFAEIGLAYQFSVALGGLIALTFVAALGRLYWKKRRLAQNQAKRDLEAAERATRKAVMQEELLGEGDYFGVRAIERGYYGGVTQSAPTSANNSPRLSPVPAIIDDNGSPISPTLSVGSSISDLSLSSRRRPRATSSVKSLNMDASIRSLRLQPSDAELSGRRNHDPAVIITTHVPRPASMLEVPTEAKPNSENIPRAYAPSSTRPTLNRQVQSYAQWRLSAELRSTARAKNRSSDSSSRDVSANNSYTHPQTGRRRSRSASTAELMSQLRSLQQQVDAIKALGFADSLAQHDPSNCCSSTEAIRAPSRRRTRSQDAERDHSASPKGATRGSKRTRDSLRLTYKSPRKARSSKTTIKTTQQNAS